MKITKGRVWGGALAAVLAMACVASAADGTLAQMLRESRWDRLIGTWVDVETGGSNSKTTYAWKLTDRVIEITSVTNGRTSIHLMGRNGKTGKIFSLGVDSDGGSSIGHYVADGEDLILELGFTSGRGVEGGMKLRHHFKDDDTVVCTIEGPQPFSITLVRLKD